MQLIDLPTELLCKIIEEALPLGYESLMLSCKNIHGIGKQFLERHTRLQRRFKHFRYDGDEISCSLVLLNQIAEDPIIAEYIQTADFSNDVSLQRLAQSDWSHWDILEPHNIATSIGKILERSNLAAYINLHLTKLISMFDLDGSKGHECVAATIVILALLPNLRELCLPPQWGCLPPPYGDNSADEREILWRALDSTVQEAKRSHHKNGALSRLTNIRTHQRWRELPPLPLSHLSPFFILPCLQEVKIHGGLANRAHHSRKPFYWRYPSYPHSNLQSIDLVGACVEGSELEKLLAHASRLQSFKLSYASTWHGIGMDWDANAVFDALQMYSTSSLTQLSITIHSLHGCIKAGLRSLRDFTGLEHLELDVRVFFGPPVVDEELRAMSPAQHRNHTYDTVHWNGLSVPQLADILPRSIRTVRLLAGSSREDVLILKGLFAKPTYPISERLPQLQSVRVVRARQQLSGTLVAEGQSDTAWESVSNVVQDMGFCFEEANVV